MVSLDFELHWGMRDHADAGDPAHRERLLGARRAVPRILAAFERHGISATWATVGFLLADSAAEAARFAPAVRPTYDDPALSAYVEPIGSDEEADPLHLAWSLVEAVAATPGQEVATHTFSHYYCLEPGQDEAGFRSDLAAAVAIARHRGLALSSIVLPRNQWNPDYAGTVRDAGLVAYRGVQAGSVYRARRHGAQSLPVRALRLADTYLPLFGSGTISWESLARRADGQELANVAASRYLRAWSPSRRALEGRRVRRVTSCIEQAARRRRLFHLWWHPHDFGADLEENLAVLEQILRAFEVQRDRHGMRSLTMAESARLARRLTAPGGLPAPGG